MSTIIEIEDSPENRFHARFMYIPLNARYRSEESLEKFAKEVKKYTPQFDFFTFELIPISKIGFENKTIKEANWIIGKLGNETYHTKEIVGYHIKGSKEFIIGAPDTKLVENYKINKDISLPLALVLENDNEEFAYKNIHQMKKTFS